MASKEARAWRAAARHDSKEALTLLRAAAEQEDALEKLVTPGPIVPAREQLGEMLLQRQRPQEALPEFQTALSNAPRSRGALIGAIAAAERLGDTRLATRLRADLNPQ